VCLVSTYLHNAYLNARKGFYLEGDDFHVGFEQSAELILNFDSTQSARRIVEVMRLMMEGDDKGAEDALRVAEHWFTASRSREQALPQYWYRVPIQTQNRFLPLIGQPISGKCFFGPARIQSPICPAAASTCSVTAVAETLLARDLWQIGECDCVCDSSEHRLRIVAFPNAGLSDTSMEIDNRVALTQVADGGGESGKTSCCVTEMPRWVAEGLAAGLTVGGTCVTCGSLISIAVDLEGVTVESAGYGGIV
jgi:hypothetical protein